MRDLNKDLPPPGGWEALDGELQKYYTGIESQPDPTLTTGPFSGWMLGVLGVQLVACCLLLGLDVDLPGSDRDQAEVVVGSLPIAISEQVAANTEKEHASPLPEPSTPLRRRAIDPRAELRQEISTMQPPKVLALVERTGVPELEVPVTVTANGPKLPSQPVSHLPATPLSPTEWLREKPYGFTALAVGAGKQKPLTHYQISLHAAPWLTRSSYYAGPTELVTASRGPAQAYVLESGETVALNEVRALDEHFRRKLTTNQIHLEVARQFGNGIRVGVGVVWSDESGKDLALLEQLPGLLPADGYAYLGQEDYQSIRTALSGQYTFRRRKRLQYSLGVLALGQVYNRYADESFLYENATGTLHRQRAVVTENYHFWPKLELRPQVGVHYRLTSQLSAGMEVTTGPYGLAEIPRFGIGARWQLR